MMNIDLTMNVDFTINDCGDLLSTKHWIMIISHVFKCPWWLLKISNFNFKQWTLNTCPCFLSSSTCSCIWMLPSWWTWICMTSGSALPWPYPETMKCNIFPIITIAVMLSSLWFSASPKMVIYRPGVGTLILWTSIIIPGITQMFPGVTHIHWQFIKQFGFQTYKSMVIIMKDLCKSMESTLYEPGPVVAQQILDVQTLSW